MEGGGQRPGNDSEWHKISLFPEDIPNSDRIPGKILSIVNMLARERSSGFGFYILHCYELNKNIIFCSTLYLQYFNLSSMMLHF